MRIFVLALSLLSILPGFSQSHSIELGYGSSIRNLIITGLLEVKQDIHVSGTGVQYLGYEHKVNDWFGIGANFTRQKLEGSYSYSFQDPVLEIPVQDNITFSNIRWSVTAEPRFYFPIASEKVELYSSFRLGYKAQNTEAHSTKNNVNEVLELTRLIKANPINVSFTPIAFNFLPVENFGLGFSGNVGATYFVMAKAFLRF